MSERDPAEVLAEARKDGIHTMPVPTPFAVGRINCYLIEGDPLTLIDAGPRSERSLAELDIHINDTGHRVEDIDLIVVTHQHIDHIGLIKTVAGRSGAEVAALDTAVKRLATFGESSDADDDLAVSLMLRHGVGEDIANALRGLSENYRSWGDQVDVTIPLGEGSHLELGDRRLKVLHRPGHSPSDTVFWDEERRMAFGGDHLLSHISSNPLISRPLDNSPGRTRALVDYTASLLETQKMPIDLMLSGHGDPITDHAGLIDKRMASQARRIEKIHGILAERPRTAHAVAEQIWGNVAVTQAFLTLSEVIGHLDILMDAGRVAEREENGLLIYEAID
ncbi:MAG TPA: MBL fold metallo-hydrolase [Solirubrobacterales bacterium]|nr:MBL fold metallo-hydrolase [Solirubrobacterales bacterium]